MNSQILHKVLSVSFSNPQALSKTVDDQITRNRSLQSKDRRILSDWVYDSIRWRRRIWGDILPSVLDENAFLKRLEEAKSLRHNPPLSKWSTMSIDSLARELSYPTWIIEKWVADLGFSSAVQLALSLNEPAPLTIRTNTLKTDRAKLKKEIQKENVTASDGKKSPWALLLDQKVNVRALKPFKTGWFEVQDEASQFAAFSSGAVKGQIVVDACTGAGGKALAMAAMMENEGQIFACDSDARKADEFKARAKRNGVKNAKYAWVAQDDPHPLPDLEGKADVVLVDAPCSSLGALRRQPSLRWEIHSSAIDRIAQRQITLLRRYSALVKPNGKLLYVTCTINKAENQDIVTPFLKENTSFALEELPIVLRPDVDGTDGFFISIFRRAK